MEFISILYSLNILRGLASVRLIFPINRCSVKPEHNLTLFQQLTISILLANSLPSLNKQKLCQKKLDTISVQSKFESATLEAELELWPTPLNLRRWHIQTGATFSLCQLPHPNSHNVLKWLSCSFTSRQVYLSLICEQTRQFLNSN